MRLTEQAREVLADAGIPVAAWLAEHPGCDRCGCSDDRCIGHHHDAAEDCGCLPVLIGLYREQPAGG